MPPGLEGRSLTPLLNNPTAAWDKPALSVVARESWLGRSIRTERWCYTEWDGGRYGVELYDHQTDPREMKNLAPDPNTLQPSPNCARSCTRVPSPGRTHEGCLRQELEDGAGRRNTWEPGDKYSPFAKSPAMMELSPGFVQLRGSLFS